MVKQDGLCLSSNLTVKRILRKRDDNYSRKNVANITFCCLVGSSNNINLLYAIQILFGLYNANAHYIE